ncbi:MULTISPECIES: helix-turn-helix domain-containing protein [Pantoea]|uniref:helix-turn-helix domain-containing protein n=1 Tax=Pantoea TaxID=53335 RepID=UPI0005359412|nr:MULTISPECIES: XRE family transcriptional regulator [Pantoea]MDT0175011.1 XRE family transcriptional regulator [Enterobacter sp. BRE11]MDU2728431.1 XRE family transcriptional regulator [Pantoea sp.]MDU5472817.1 XRE family transcriptional regulator [Pantoea sp.]MDU6079299.1 XRE family transcriptional regulator [Pantoea sp.]MDU6390275.1 XRE family transcriptional regulator [Pantoea sp.]
MENLHQHLSEALKQLRQANGWSLTLAAERTGVSKAMLGQIERGESSPTVATLWKIATGFNVPFSFFIQGNGLQSGDSARFSQPNAQMTVRPLLPYDARLRFDLLAVELAAGAQSDSSPHEQGCVEQVVVIEGELLLGTGGVWRRLQTGEALQFAADVAHSYRNPLATPLRFHSLIHYLQRPDLTN